MEAGINDISASIIKDSADKDTIQTTVTLSSGAKASFSVPSGESTGGFEATLVEPVRAAALINNQLKTVLVNKVFNPESLDNFLLSVDSSENKSNLGANTILSISIAFFKALAISNVIPLYSLIHQYMGNTANTPLKIPRPMINIIEGGKHAPNNVDFQEFLLLPNSNSIEKDILDAKLLVDKIKSKYSDGVSQGMEGGVVIDELTTNEQALEVFQEMVRSLDESNFEISIDAAANSFKQGGEYAIKDLPEPATPQTMVEFYQNLVNKYKIFSIEDPFSEDEWASWETLKSGLAGKTKIIGDDLTVTNLGRVEEAIKLGAVDGIIVKPNQIGSLSETIRVVQRAKENNLIVIVSNRGRETMDDFIADLAVGVGADFLKAGNPARPEREAKYQRLSAIQNELE